MASVFKCSATADNSVGVYIHIYIMELGSHSSRMNSLFQNCRKNSKVLKPLCSLGCLGRILNASQSVCILSFLGFRVVAGDSGTLSLVSRTRIPGILGHVWKIE